MIPESQRLKTILVLDDESPIRRSMGAFFTDLGYQAVECGVPTAALEILGSQKIDVAVVDLEMPVMNGVKFIEKAKSVQPATRYVVYTGSLSSELLSQLETIGIPHNLVLQKPLTSIGEMLEAVQRAFYGD